MKFKEQWVQRDELCDHCGAITKPAKGMNKQNMKRLFLSKPSAQDWIMLFIWVSALIIAFSYNTEVAECRDVVNNFDSLCIQYLTSATPVDPMGNTINALPDNFTFNLVNEIQEK